MAKKSEPRSVLELKLITELWQEHILEHTFRCAEKMYNIMARHAINCVNMLKKNEEYQALLVEYSKCPDTEAGKEEKKLICKQLNPIVKSYGLSEYDFHAYISKMKNESFQGVLDIDTAQKLATRVWRAVEKVLYSNGKKIHFKKYGTLDSIESKKNSCGIKFNVDKQIVSFKNMKIPVKIRNNDSYANELLTHKICYCRIVRKAFNSGYKYFIQIVLVGHPDQRPQLGKGNVGIDMGTSSVAAIGDTDGLFNALGNNMKKDKTENKTIDFYNKKICKLSRKLERQLRLNNPDNYDENGCVKKCSSKWKRTNGYLNTLFQLKSIYRKKSEFIEQQHNITANKILALGDVFYTEPMNWKALQKKSSCKSKNKDGTETVANSEIISKSEAGASNEALKSNDSTSVTSKNIISSESTKRKRIRRFGKSLNNHSPSKLESIINRKLSYYDKSLNYVNLQTYRASQYNPETCLYKKYGLDVRFKELFGRLIQRDLLSAFLLQNPLDDLMQIDINTINRKIENFFKIHDRIIEQVKGTPKLPKCMGI